jgi:hypothetical protein
MCFWVHDDHSDFTCVQHANSLPVQNDHQGVIDVHSSLWQNLTMSNSWSVILSPHLQMYFVVHTDCLIHHLQICFQYSDWNNITRTGISISKLSLYMHKPERAILSNLWSLHPTVFLINENTYQYNQYNYLIFSMLPANEWWKHSWLKRLSTCCSDLYSVQISNGTTINTLRTTQQISDFPFKTWQAERKVSDF